MHDRTPVTDLVRHRTRTLEVLKPWGMSAVWAHPGTRVPIDKITDASFLEVQKEADVWARHGKPFNLLGVMPVDMVDFDLDVRLKDNPGSRAPDWSAEDKAGAEEIFRLFRESLKTIPGFDFRAMFGRASLGGNGHCLIRIASPEGMPDDIRRGRLARLGFEVDLGWFTVKLEVRQSSRKKESRKTCVLPGSTYPGDWIRFFSVPNGPVGPANSVLMAFPLEDVAKAIYRTAFLLALEPLAQEGERHEIALLASGVLRREVDFTENEGEGGLNRDEARELFLALFQGDPELKDRLGVFEHDMALAGIESLPGYRLLGERIGERAANALKSMLHGQATDALDEMRNSLVFVRGAGSWVVDLSQAHDTEALVPCTHNDMRATYAHKTTPAGRKRVLLFDRLRATASRRQVDGTINIPGCPRGQELWQLADGRLVEEPGERSRHLVNLGAGWAWPYREEPLARRAEAEQDLRTMTGWLSPSAADHAKLMQMWSFKAQNPMTKPQFALGIYGGQGIGKNVVLEQMPQKIFGMSVKHTTAEMLFGTNYSLQSALGSSFLVVDEVTDLQSQQLAKDLARNERHEINVKYGAKGYHRLFTIPIYISNESHPEFSKAGEIERTLYVIKGYTPKSLGCQSLVDYEAFKTRRKTECADMLAKFEDDNYCLAIMQIFMEYPVTQADLEDIWASDSFSEDYIGQGMSAERLALAKLLETNCIHPRLDGPPPLSLPFDRGLFDEGFNYYYQQYAPREKPLSGRRINQVLQECLRKSGELQSGRAHEAKRMYWFPAKLGTLCDVFKEMTGADIPRDTQEHEQRGAYEPDPAVIRNRANVFGGLDRRGGSY